MDAAARFQAMELLGRFNDDLTRVIDGVFGTQWAEIEEMAAIAALSGVRAVTTRRLAEVTRLNRRAVSRMVQRMREGGLVETRPSTHDKRAVEVVLTPRGRRLGAVLRTEVTEFFRRSADVARTISDGMQALPAPAAPAEPADAIDLLQRVCEAGVALVRSMPGAVTEGRLAARQRAALVMIATRGGLRPNDLSPALDVSRAGVAYIADQLSAKGLVVRRRGVVAADRRAVVLEATPDGLAAVGAVLNGIQQQGPALAALFTEVAAWGEPAGEEPSAARDTSHGRPSR